MGLYNFHTTIKPDGFAPVSKGSGRAKRNGCIIEVRQLSDHQVTVPYEIFQRVSTIVVDKQEVNRLTTEIYHSGQFIHRHVSYRDHPNHLGDALWEKWLKEGQEAGGSK